MGEFSIMGAWALGYRFVAARPLQHIALLFGIGLLVPIAIQVVVGLLTGQNAFLDANGTNSVVGLVTTVINWVLQTGALFASLRFGVADRTSFGGALAYGLLAGLVVTISVALLLSITAMSATQFGPPGIVFFVMLGVLIPVMIALALYYTLLSALLGVGAALILVLMMVFGAATGDVGLAATYAGGGSGFVVVLLVILSVVLLWLAARLSCTAAIMAERKSVNVIAAMRASWEMTADEQLRILLHLIVVGFALVILLLAVAATVGAGLAATGGVMAPGAALVPLLLMVLLVVPFLFLTVMVPVGIYRQLAGERAPVEVFA